MALPRNFSSREWPSFFSTSNTCDVLFCLKSCGYLRTAKRVICMADQSDVNHDTFRHSDLLAAQTSDEFWRMVLEKISSVNNFEIRNPFSCLVMLCFHPLYVFIFCFDL